MPLCCVLEIKEKYAIEANTVSHNLITSLINEELIPVSINRNE